MNSSNIPNNLSTSDTKINNLFLDIKNELKSLGKEKEINILDGLKGADKELNTSFSLFADQMEQVDKDSPIRGQLIELQKAFYQLQLKIIFSEIKKIKSVDVNPLIVAITNKVNAMNKFIDQQSDVEIKAKLQDNVIVEPKNYTKLKTDLEPIWTQIQKKSYGVLTKNENSSRREMVDVITAFIVGTSKIDSKQLRGCGELCDINDEITYYIFGNNKMDKVAPTTDFNTVFDKIESILKRFFVAVGSQPLSSAIINSKTTLQPNSENDVNLSDTNLGQTLGSANTLPTSSRTTPTLTTASATTKERTVANQNRNTSQSQPINPPLNKAQPVPNPSSSEKEFTENYAKAETSEQKESVIETFLNENNINILTETKLAGDTFNIIFEDVTNREKYKSLIGVGYDDLIEHIIAIK